MRMTKNLFPMVAILFLVSACGALSYFSGADGEFEEGLGFFNRGQYYEAIPHFERATEIDPEFARAYLYLGRSYVSLKRWREAIPPLRTAYRLAPQQTKREALDVLIDGLFGVALDDFASGNFSASIDNFREVLQLQPTSDRGKSEMVKALVAHGGQLLSKGNVSQAIAAYTEAVQLSPNAFDAQFGLAKSFFRNGDYQKAWQAAQDAIRVNPGNPEAEFFLRDLPGR